MKEEADRREVRADDLMIAEGERPLDSVYRYDSSTGTVRIEAQNGCTIDASQSDIEADIEGGVATVKSDGGDIDITIVEGARIVQKNGNVHVQIESPPEGKKFSGLDVTVAKGDVEVVMPPDFQAPFDLLTGDGVVRCPDGNCETGDEGAGRQIRIRVEKGDILISSR
jgi:hypothetical protein